jgi:hypothetical protein
VVEVEVEHYCSVVAAGSELTRPFPSFLWDKLIQFNSPFGQGHDTTTGS